MSLKSFKGDTVFFCNKFVLFSITMSHQQDSFYPLFKKISTGQSKIGGQCVQWSTKYYWLHQNILSDFVLSARKKSYESWKKVKSYLINKCTKNLYLKQMWVKIQVIFFWKSSRVFTVMQFPELYSLWQWRCHQQ